MKKEIKKLSKIQELEARIFRLENPNKFKLGQRVKFGWKNIGVIVSLPEAFGNRYDVVCEDSIYSVREDEMERASFFS